MVWVTLAIVTAFVIINMYVLFYMLCSKKLKNDKKLQDWL